MEIIPNNFTIIGTGPAGLTAGLELLRQSHHYQVTILEATNQVGGISRTTRHNGQYMDIGGHRFFTQDKSVSKFWHDFDDILLTRNRVSRIYYNNKFFDYPINLNYRTLKNLGLNQSYRIGTSYLKSTFSHCPEKSLEDFYINRFGQELYHLFFEDYTNKLWGKHPSQISPSWGKQRIKNLSIYTIIRNFFNTKSNTSQFLYPKHGPGELWEAVAKEFQQLGGKIQLNTKVTKIHQQNNKITSLTVNQNGKIRKISGDIFISSMPLKDLIAGMDHVPKNIHQIASNLPYRNLISIGILIKRPPSNLMSDCWIYMQDSRVKIGRIQIYNNWSSYLVKNPDKTVWLGVEYFCDENDSFWQSKDQNCIDFAISELSKIGFINKSDILDTCCERVEKAYPAYFGSYNQINELIQYLNQFENLYCIGRNGQHRYNSMDHSMLTAFEAVKNIINHDSDKSNIWNINTKQEYQEDISEVA